MKKKSEEISAKIQVLEAVAKHWSKLQGKDNISFLFDYKGPQGSDISLREAMSQEVLETDTLTNLIDTRMAEYQSAAKESRKKEVVSNYMTIKKATDILKKYNEWRRCSEMVNKHKCPPPKQIGEAIEVAVDFMANASSEN